MMSADDEATDKGAMDKSLEELGRDRDYWMTVLARQNDYQYRHTGGTQRAAAIKHLATNELARRAVLLSSVMTGYRSIELLGEMHGFLWEILKLQRAASERQGFARWVHELGKPQRSRFSRWFHSLKRGEV